MRSAVWGDGSADVIAVGSGLVVRDPVEGSGDHRGEIVGYLVTDARSLVQVYGCSRLLHALVQVEAVGEGAVVFSHHDLGGNSLIGRASWAAFW